MKNILERFEKLAAAHGLNADCAAAMRGLLSDAHTAGFQKHMDIAEAAHANADEEQDAMPPAACRDDNEPEEDDEATERMVGVVRKAVRKAVRKEMRAHKKSMRKEVRKIVNGIAATHPGASALAQ